MIKKISLLLAGLLVSAAFVGVVHAQPTRRPKAKPASGPRMTVTGLLYFAGDGQGVQTCLLKTPEGIIEISVTGQTRIVNFPAGGTAWDFGAEWRVTYRESKDAALGLEAETVTFTGNSNATIAVAQSVARDYLTALSADSKDYERAYALLSAAAKQRVGLADFKIMYKPVEFDLRSIKVCSHSDEKVVLMLTFFGDGSDFFQRVEMVPTDNETFKNQARINHLFELGKNVDEAEAACRKQ